MDPKYPDVIHEIVRDSHGLAELLRRKQWPEIVRFLASVSVTIKGISRDAAYLGKFLMMWTADIREPEIVVDELLDIHVESDRVHLAVRVAALGMRTESGLPDGVIMDSRLDFIHRDGEWRVVAAVIDCPPEWAQWKSRPNERAPVDYASAAWWQQRLKMAVGGPSGIGEIRPPD